MKKKLLIFAGSFLLTVAVAQAQQDSTRSSTGSQGATGSTPTTTSPQQPTRQQPNQQGQSQYRTENMTVIQHDQLPSSLQETLRGSEYQGWENSKIYRDPVNGEYLLEMNSSSSATSTPPTGGSTTQTQPTYYRFDKNGKAIKQDNSGGSLDDN